MPLSRNTLVIRMLQTEDFAASPRLPEMTTPDERTRAVAHTKMFLRELMCAEDTPGVPVHIREQARRLLRHYPGDAELNLASMALPHLFAEVRHNLQPRGEDERGGGL